jgi:hypothetical protein
VTSEYSSSEEEEEEESEGGQAPLRGGSLHPPHREPQRRRRNKHLGRSTEEAACAVEVPVCAAEASGGATAAETVVDLALAEPSRKRKHGLSTLR